MSSVRAARNLTLSLLVLVVCAIGAQQLVAEKSKDQQTAQDVCRMMDQFHISKKKFDDKISEQLFDKFIDDLDPQKLYFLQSDIDSFSAYRDELDNLIKEQGNVDFAYDLFDLFLKRMDERIELAQKLVDRDHDFTVDETVVFDGDELEWAASEEEITERWRKRVKYDLLSMKLDDTELDEARERLHKRYHLLKETMHQTEKFETFETFLSALTHCFDPHSTYMSPQTLEEFQIQMRLSLQGIGAQLRSEDGTTTINKIIPGGAAAKDGRLEAGDKIVAVAQEDGEWVDVVEMKLSKVVRYIRGKAGTIVQLKVVKGDTNETVVYRLTRQKVELTEQAVSGRIIEGAEWFPNSPGGRIGVIHIPSFYRDFSGAQAGKENFRSTSRDVLEVLQDFQEQGGVDGIVIDLRSNGGGALSEAIDVSGLFVGRGPIVQVKDSAGRVKAHSFDIRDPNFEGPVYSGPLVVVINRLSASASEIFAGAIKDYGRGIVIGDTTTHGKGTVQNVLEVKRNLFNLGGGERRGALKVTINQFYRVNGASTQKEGVKSDIVLPSRIDNMDLGEAFLDNALAFDSVDEVERTQYGYAPQKIIDSLKQASKTRLHSNDHFKKLMASIDRYVARKNRKKIPLKESVLRAERDAEKELEDEQDDLEEQLDAEDPFPKIPYNEEVVKISLDYVKALENRKTAGKN
jgi:carboxyl-terminal processing protease